ARARQGEWGLPPPRWVRLRHVAPDGDGHAEREPQLGAPRDGSGDLLVKAAANRISTRTPAPHQRDLPDDDGERRVRDERDRARLRSQARRRGPELKPGRHRGLVRATSRVSAPGVRIPAIALL